MVEKLVVGPINKGLKTDRVPFVIDNDSFPVLQNAYQWRGRVKRKRGTTFLGQLQRYFDSTSTAYSSFADMLFDGSGNGNLLTGANSFLRETNSSIIPGTVTITDAISSVITTDPAMDGTLSPAGTINYATGAVNIAASAGHQATAQFVYAPQLPVMGLEETFLNPSVPPGTMAFDTKYSYLISQADPYPIDDVSFYLNPASNGAYVAKSVWTPTTWNGQDYQQFWTTNYAGALWATNGINIPFSPTNVGMQFALASTITYISNTATTLTISITNCPLVIGDFVFANEWKGVGTAGLNFQSGFVTAAAPNTTPLATKTITITFPNATLAAVVTWTPGIIQYLTNRSSTTVDCIRWFNGDPTTGTIPPVFQNGFGWVNYMPPLSQFIYSIADLPLRQYYLVGCRMIVPLKDRLLFFGPVVQASTGNSIYLQDTVIYTQNGTPYYTASYTNPNPLIDTPTSIKINFNPILVPVNQTATSPALFEDQIGFGGFTSAGVSDQITSIGKNEDALIVGFTRFQTRLLSTGDDINPFEFFVVNSELGTTSTFSTVTMDQGVFSRGSRGFIITGQTSAERFDMDVIDQVFNVNPSNNGDQRFTSQRDFLNEWIYFTYNSDQSAYRYPNQTLLYNYRDNSFGLFNESYTTYGQFNRTSGGTWAQLNTFTWANWNTPWNSGNADTFQPLVIGGNQQGFVLIRDTDTTQECDSLTIQSISTNVITCPNHNLTNGDFITINGAIGTNVNLINGQVFQVSSASTNTFAIVPNPGTVTYQGLGYITRMYIPVIQTKQFPAAWSISRKTRIGPQQYLLTKTPLGQITLQIYLSQDAGTDWNNPNIDNGNVFSQVLYTCAESTNLGLTPLNTNLNMLIQPGTTAGTGGTSGSAQMWHRINTSLIGDTIQLGFTLSQEQMFDPNLALQFEEIELHGFIIDVSSSGMLS